MSNKTKSKKTISDTFHTIGLHAGLLAMTAAATTGLIEVPGVHHEKKAMLGHQPAYAFAGAPQSGFDRFETGENQRREREEVHPHGSSYGVSQRTPGRTGRA